ncbi:MAG: hypothetical protein QM756_36040 [Polyangiaceae bacterium]
MSRSDLERAVASLARAVRPGGHIVITDLHPAAVAAGLETIFSVGGAEYAIATVTHSVDGYLNALQAAGASLRAVEECKLGDAVSSPAGLPPGVARGNWQSLPFCLVITARRPDSGAQ